MNAQTRKKSTKPVEILGEKGPLTEMMLFREWRSGRVRGTGGPLATLHVQIDPVVKKKIEAAAKYQGCSQVEIVGYVLRQSGERLHYMAGGDVMEGGEE